MSPSRSNGSTIGGAATVGYLLSLDLKTARKRLREWLALNHQVEAAEAAHDRAVAERDDVAASIAAARAKVDAAHGEFERQVQKAEYEADELERQVTVGEEQWRGCDNTPAELYARRASENQAVQ